MQKTIANFYKAKMRFSVFLTILGIILITVLGACSAARFKSENQVYYTNSKNAPLLSTNVLNSSLDMRQHLTGNFIKESGDSLNFDGEVFVLANDTVLSIVLFSTMTSSIAEITYKHDSISFESAFLDVKQVKAAYILADFQMCFYPFKSLKENFEKTGLTFKETSNGSDFTRTLYDNEIILSKASKKGNEITFVNYVRNYNYQIVLEH